MIKPSCTHRDDDVDRCNAAASTSSGTSAEAAPPTSLSPVIPGAQQYRYYRAPHGMKQLRNKRKVAIVFGYNGERYCGLQWNHKPEYPTIEEALLKALFETDMISLANFAHEKVQTLLNFERASRTDKGVHALCNVVNVCVMLPYDPAHVARMTAASCVHSGACNGASQTSRSGVHSSPAEANTLAGDEAEEGRSTYSCSEAKRLLNVALPDDIHVFDVIPVTRSFNCYLNCGGRKYEYYIPTFAFMPREDYVTQYFPSSLAPAQPSSIESGTTQNDTDSTTTVQTTEAAKQVHASNNTYIDGTSASAVGDVDECYTLYSYAHKAAERNADGSVRCGRKSKGHFPQRKSKRYRMGGSTAGAESSSETHDIHDGAKAATQPGGDENCEYANMRDETSSNNVNTNSSTDSNESAGNSRKDMICAKGSNSNDARGSTTIAGCTDQTAVLHSLPRLDEVMTLFRYIPDEAMQRATSYRISDTQLARVRSIAALYQGTHSFHNFTPGGYSGDASCHRFIRQVSVSDPTTVYPSDADIVQSIRSWSPRCCFAPDEDEHTSSSSESKVQKRRTTPVSEETTQAVVDGSERMETTGVGNSSALLDADEMDAVQRAAMQNHLSRVYGKSGLEVVRVCFDGQSFMLNQIRKMIGALVCITATGLSKEYVTEVLLRKGVQRGIPMAPANGLFLVSLDFAGYNARLTRIQRNGNNGANKYALDVCDIDAAEMALQRRRIAAVVLRNEMARDMMGTWMRSLRHVVRLTWHVDLP